MRLNNSNNSNYLLLHPQCLLVSLMEALLAVAAVAAAAMKAQTSIMLLKRHSILPIHSLRRHLQPRLMNCVEEAKHRSNPMIVVVVNSVLSLPAYFPTAPQSLLHPVVHVPLHHLLLLPLHPITRLLGSLICSISSNPRCAQSLFVRLGCLTFCENYIQH